MFAPSHLHGNLADLLYLDVALLAFYTGLSTLASMAQQLHSYLRWTSIKLEQFDYVRSNLGNPELSVAGPSVGIDIIFFYIRTHQLPCTSDAGLTDIVDRILLL